MPNPLYGGHPTKRWKQRKNDLLKFMATMDFPNLPDGAHDAVLVDTAEEFKKCANVAGEPHDMLIYYLEHGKDEDIPQENHRVRHAIDLAGWKRKRIKFLYN